MKKYFTAFSMTQSMFCHIPFPIKEWDEKSRPYMLLFLPLVGLEIGVLWLLAHRVMVLLNMPRYIYAFAMTTVPFLLAGFIHLDGFMDVCDAVGSWKSAARYSRIPMWAAVRWYGAHCCFWVFLRGLPRWRTAQMCLF